MIAGPVRNCERLVVQYSYKAGGITLGRDVEPSVRTARRDHYEGRSCDEPSAMIVDVIDYLCSYNAWRFAYQLAQSRSASDLLLVLAHNLLLLVLGSPHPRGAPLQMPDRTPT